MNARVYMTLTVLVGLDYQPTLLSSAVFWLLIGCDFVRDAFLSVSVVGYLQGSVRY